MCILWMSGSRLKSYEINTINQCHTEFSLLRGKKKRKKGRCSEDIRLLYHNTDHPMPTFLMMCSVVVRATLMERSTTRLSKSCTAFSTDGFTHCFNCGYCCSNAICNVRVNEIVYPMHFQIVYITNLRVDLEVWSKTCKGSCVNIIHKKLRLSRWHNSTMSKRGSTRLWVHWRRIYREEEDILIC